MTKRTHKICIILIIVPSAFRGTGPRFLIGFQLLMSQNEVFSVRLTLVSVRVTFRNSPVGDYRIVYEIQDDILLILYEVQLSPLSCYKFINSQALKNISA